MVGAPAATPRVQAEVVTVCGDQGGSVLCWKLLGRKAAEDVCQSNYCYYQHTATSRRDRWTRVAGPWSPRRGLSPTNSKLHFQNLTDLC